VPQETHLAFDYSVLEIVLMGRYPHLRPFELEGPGDLALAREALAATGTLPLERRPYATLSGGEKQRVIIASALAQAPAIMLLDEPTASLDPGYQIEIASLLRSLKLGARHHDDRGDARSELRRKHLPPPRAPARRARAGVGADARCPHRGPHRRALRRRGGREASRSRGAHHGGADQEDGGQTVDSG